MNKIYEQSYTGAFIETNKGSEDRDDAISQMITMCGDYITEYQKTGKRATIESGIWDNKFVVRVINNKIVLKRYYIIK